MTKTITGVEKLINDQALQSKIKGNIAVLCHSASITSDFTIIVSHLKKIYGERLKSIWGPQHGFVTDVQDNMIETKSFHHQYFDLPVHSLYSKHRVPTEKMLAGIDTIIVDLQDVGCRVYTYISTLALIMEACQQRDIKIVVLDRPNPVGGEIIEGMVLEQLYKSFVGHAAIPLRHGLTIGEFAQFMQKVGKIDCQLDVIPMQHWQRQQHFSDTGLPWAMPSPNLPTMSSALNFCNTVHFEGTKISEGRGTTRSLEILGHPKIECYSFSEKCNAVLTQQKLKGVMLRPLNFMPTFQKHRGKTCGGFQLHITDAKIYRPWTVGQILLREFIQQLGSDFKWNEDMYEYETEHLAIDYINGGNELRHWALNNGHMGELKILENKGLSEYMDQRAGILIY